MVIPVHFLDRESSEVEASVLSFGVWQTDQCPTSVSVSTSVTNGADTKNWNWKVKIFSPQNSKALLFFWMKNPVFSNISQVHTRGYWGQATDRGILCFIQSHSKAEMWLGSLSKTVHSIDWNFSKICSLRSQLRSVIFRPNLHFCLCLKLSNQTSNTRRLNPDQRPAFSHLLL